MLFICNFSIHNKTLPEDELSETRNILRTVNNLTHIVVFQFYSIDYL